MFPFSKIIGGHLTSSPTLSLQIKGGSRGLEKERKNEEKKSPASPVRWVGGAGAAVFHPSQLWLANIPGRGDSTPPGHHRWKYYSHEIPSRKFANWPFRRAKQIKVVQKRVLNAKVFLACWPAQNISNIYVQANWLFGSLHLTSPFFKQNETNSYLSFGGGEIVFQRYKDIIFIAHKKV